MNYKERILTTLRGEPTDQLPFVPRIDNWFYAQKANGTLPDEYKNATLQEIVDDLGIGYHSIIPNFSGYRKEGYQDLHVGLGIYDLEMTPWKVVFHNVGITSERDGKGGLTVVYDTPKGKIVTQKVYTNDMVKNGITLHVIREHALKSSDDYDALLYIFQNAEVIPEYEAYTNYKEKIVGDRGVAVALSAMWASAGHWMVKELMGYTDFYCEWMEDSGAMDDFSDALQPFCDKLFNAALNSPAEVILSGANYDFMFTTPDIVDHYVVDALDKYSRLAHEKGKFIASHTDGNNTQLLNLYMKAGFDIADSICPSPMTRVTLKETIDTFKGTKTIWGGIPSISVLKDCMSDEAFYKLVDETLEIIGRGDHFIVSVADTLPPAADFKRLMYLKKACEDFGPIK